MGDYIMFASPVPQYMIRVRRPKVCTACLREKSYARRIWELAPVTTCPTHTCLLLDECPKCVRPISWARAKVSVCQCDFDWRDFESPYVDESELRVSSQIQLRCKLRLPKGSIERDAIDCPIYNVDLKSFLSALFFIASQYAGGMDTKGKHLAPSTKNIELHRLLSRAFAVFENWPNNYFEFLDWRKAQATEAQPAGGLRRDFAGYKSALYLQLASSQLDFMRIAFEQYLPARWDGGYTAHLRRLDEAARLNGKYASRREAKRLLKIGVQGIDNLIAAGKLKAMVRHRKGSRLILIERECLREFERELECSLYLKQVEKALGVSHRRVIELVDAGLLSPLRGPSVDGCSDWRFAKSEVEGLLARTKENVRAAEMKAGSTVSFLMAFRKLARVNVGMGQFLRAILESEIAPCGETAKPGLSALLFLQGQVSDFARRRRHSQIGETYSAREAAKLLRVTPDVVYFLVRKGILSSRSRVGERYPDLLIGKDDLKLFNSIYVLPAKVAARLGTISGHLTRLLTTRGIQPISGPKVDGGRQYVFRRSDLDAVNVDELVSAGSRPYLGVEYISS